LHQTDEQLRLTELKTRLQGQGGDDWMVERKTKITATDFQESLRSKRALDGHKN